MNTHADKTKVTNSQAAPNTTSESKGNKGLNLVDNRPQAIAQRKLHTAAIT